CPAPHRTSCRGAVGQRTWTDAARLDHRDASRNTRKCTLATLLVGYVTRATGSARSEEPSRASVRAVRGRRRPDGASARLCRNDRTLFLRVVRFPPHAPLGGHGRAVARPA